MHYPGASLTPAQSDVRSDFRPVVGHSRRPHRAGTSKRARTSPPRSTSSKPKTRCCSGSTRSRAGWAKTGRRTSLRSMRPLGTKDPFSMPMSTGARPRRSRPSRTCSRRRSLSRTRRDSRRWKRHSSRLHGKTRRDQAGRCKRFCLRWPQYSIAVSALLAK